MFQECLPIQTHGNRREFLTMCSQNKSTEAFFSAVGVLMVLLQDRFVCFKIILVSVTKGWEEAEGNKINALGMS